MRHIQIGSLILCLGLAVPGYSQGNTTGSALFTPTNILIASALFLLIVIFLLANTLRLAMKAHYADRKKEGDQLKSMTKSSSLLWVPLLLQGGVSTVQSVDLSSLVLYGTLLFIILIELIAIFVLVSWIKYFTGIDGFVQKVRNAENETRFTFGMMWDKINKFRPLSEEQHIDTGHSYDDIRELDNVTPPWFIIAFAASIVFGAFYLYNHNITGSIPSQYTEYEREVVQARIAKAELLANQANLVDESNVTMADESGIKIGASLFNANCVACHGDKGQGTVGPNLTDDYWLHGGSLNDIFAVIKYGVVDKGMKSWSEDFSPAQIANITSYIRTLRGTNPPAPKEKQGELYNYNEENNTSADTTSTPTE